MTAGVHGGVHARAHHTLARAGMGLILYSRMSCDPHSFMDAPRCPSRY